MQTLGLDGSPPPEPWYKLWVWPDVEHPEGAVSAARNGAIASIVIGLFTSVVGVMQAGPGALLDGAFFLLVAIGIRQLSFPASAMAVALYVLSQVAGIVNGRSPGIVGLALSILLVGSARASWKCLRMSAQDRALAANDSPLDTWSQRVLRQLGSPFWAKIRMVFNVLMLIYFALLVTGTFLVMFGVG